LVAVCLTYLITSQYYQSWILQDNFTKFKASMHLVYP